MIRKINSDNSNYKFLSLTGEEYFTEFNKIYTRNNSFRKYRGFAVQTEKGKNNLYFPTKRPSKYEEVINRNGVETVKQLKWEYIYTSLLSAYKDAKSYKQVMAGLDHYHRGVMIADCDHDFKSNTIINVNNICINYGIPKPTCFVVNPKTNHYQIHWYLKDAYEKPYSGNFSKKMHTIRKEINLLFEGDSSFTGGFIKNPYFDGLNTTWNNKNLIDRSTLEHSISRAFIDEFHMTYEDFKRSQKQLKTGKKKLNNEKKAIVLKLSKIEAKSRSRHMESLTNARTDTFAYMRENDGKIDRSYIKERVIFWQNQVISEIIDPNRTTIEDDATIDSIVDSIYTFCKDNYNFTSNRTSKKINNLNHEYGTFINTLEGKLNFFTMLYLREVEHKATREIAEELGCTVTCVNRSIRLNKDKIEEGFDLIKTFYGQHRYLQDETSVRVCELINALFNRIGYKYTEEDEEEAKNEEYITNDVFFDRLFALYAECAVIEHCNGYVEFDHKYCKKYKPKIA